MAIKLFDAVGFISVNAKALEKGMTKARRFVNKGMAGIGKIIKKGAKVAALALAAIGVAATLVGVKILQMGADAEESENLFEVSMGNMADAAREWSIELSRSLGLNQFEVRKTVGVFNQMLSSLGLSSNAAFNMAKSLTVLSADMASFFNLAQEDAFLKLQAGITGEIEPLKRLGIVLNQSVLQQKALELGINKTVLAMTEAEKVQLRFAVIMEQTALAQGDLARTQDSVTNRMRTINNAIAEIATGLGQSLQPALKTVLGEVVKVVESVAKFFERNTEEFGLMAEMLVLIGETIVRILIPDFKKFGVDGAKAVDVVLNKLVDLQEWLEKDGPAAWEKFKKETESTFIVLKNVALWIIGGVGIISAFATLSKAIIAVNIVLPIMATGLTAVAAGFTALGVAGVIGLGGGILFFAGAVLIAAQNVDRLADAWLRLKSILAGNFLVGANQNANIDFSNLPLDFDFGGRSTGGDGSRGNTTIQRVDINVQGGESSQVIGNAVAAALLDLGQGNLFSRGGIAVTP